MNKIAGFFMALLMPFLSSGQSRNEINKALAGKIVEYYNNGLYKDIYLLFAPDVKQQISEPDLIGFLTSVSPAGKILSADYLHEKDGFSVFKASFEKGVFNLLVAGNNNGMITGFAITPYREAPAGMPVGILTTNKKSSSLDLEVDKAVASFMSNPQNAGLSIAIVKDGQTQFYHYGEARKGTKQLPDNETIYEIGSITKTFTGILLAKAVEDKKLSLDDDVRKYLPSQCANLAFGNHPVLVKHLANHTSGIPRIPDNLESQPGYDALNPYKNYKKDMWFAYLSKLSLQSKPGEVQEYSNTGTALLGLILENVYGMEYYKLVKAFIAKPLKMETTFVTVPDNRRNNLAKGYFQGNENPYWDFGDTPAFGGLNSTIEDMSLYLKANIDNSIPYIRFSHEPTYNHRDESTGLGWFMFKTKKDDTLIWHNGGTYGFSSYMGYLKDKKAGVVVLGNSFTNGELDEIGIALLKYLQE